MACQGGGSLGAYHIGALKAMEEAEYWPGILAGISIGAFTAAIIAGSEPKERLKKLEAFWEKISWSDLPDIPGARTYLDQWYKLFDPLHLMPSTCLTDYLLDPKRWHNLMSSMQGFVWGQPHFFGPRFPPPQLHASGTTGATSFYDTTSLRATLEELVDFERINAGNQGRLILGVTHVKSGDLRFFKSGEDKPLGPDHVMASGAMPPGFPGVRIDGELYWDGGCASNTPLDGIYDEARGKDTLCCVVDLFGPSGREPQDLGEVMLTQKEIQYSSRIKDHIRLVNQRHILAHHLHKTSAGKSKSLMRHLEKAQVPRPAARHRFDIVHVLYDKPDSEEPTCDCEFSTASIRARAAHGYEDLKKALAENARLNKRAGPALKAISSVTRTFKGGRCVESSLEA